MNKEKIIFNAAFDWWRTAWAQMPSAAIVAARTRHGQSLTDIEDDLALIRVLENVAEK